MSFDFDTLADRKNGGNMKWIDTPAAVREAGGVTYCGAEMDFKTAPAIMEALEEKARNGLYGYTICDDVYRNATIQWMKNRRHLHLEPEWIVPTNGTLQSIGAAIRAFTQEGDGIVIQPPVYLLYRRVIQSNNRKVVNNPLLYESGSYEMDFIGLEKLFADERTKLMILCNPHNPIGKVWSKAVLTRIAELANRYGIVVVSDEIFGEVVLGDHQADSYLTIPGAESHGIVTTSLGKVFNFTGFSHANAFLASPTLRKAFLKQRETDGYGSINPFIREALVAGYQRGGDWVDAMLAYVQENVNRVCTFFRTHLPQVKVADPEGTYLVWIDWNALGMNEEELDFFLQEEAVLDLDRGSLFGEGGEGFSRMNLATPRKPLEEALDRLLAAAEKRGYAKSIREVYGYDK